MAWSLLLLAGVLLGAGILLTGAAIVVMAWSLLRPPRMTDGKAAWLLQRLSPGDLALAYEEASYSVRDVRTGGALRMAAWWIPAAAASDRCVVLLHGYADAKVGAVAWAPVWHRLGYHILAPDLRAHGESEGRESTAGYFERHDVEQVISQLRAERPATTRHVVLFGASLGAAVATAVAALRDDVAAVVLESPYTDFCSAAMTHMDLLGLPGHLLQRAALRLAEWLAYAKFDDVNTIDLLRTVRCPVLVIAPAGDVFLPNTAMTAFEAALAGRRGSAVWRVQGAAHMLAVQADADAYARRLQDFLAEALGASPNAQPATNPAAAANRQAMGVNAAGGAV
jgi:pimeloyl-ACP methyl ester carboxylesterase